MALFYFIWKFNKYSDNIFLLGWKKKKVLKDYAQILDFGQVFIGSVWICVFLPSPQTDQGL